MYVRQGLQSASSARRPRTATMSHPQRTFADMSNDHEPWRVRPCHWCGRAIVIVRRPGRPRLYCNQPCRQRAYEFRCGRGVLPPRQASPARPAVIVPVGLARLPGYERATFGPMRGRHHALRTAGVAERAHRRPTLCGLLARPARGWFVPDEPDSCLTCARIATARPLPAPVHASTDLAHLRAVLSDAAVERRRRDRPLDVATLLDRVLAADEFSRCRRSEHA